MTATFAAPPAAFAGDPAPNFKKVLAEVDTLGTFEGKDFSCVYTMVSEKPGEKNSVPQARLFRRDVKDQYTILILQPEAQKGQGYLRVEDVVWFYDPESRQFEKSTMREALAGTKAQGSDFSRRRFSEDYAVAAWQESTLGVYPVYVLDLTAVRSDVPYEKARIWVRKDLSIVLKLEDYSVSGRLMRTSLFPRYAMVDKKYVPSQMLIVDELNKGERTQLTLSDPSVAAVPDYVFTKQYLELVNK
ncbi:MAG: outer membrane lipoprotein-sorting protein [Planctomycetota bacterium]